MGVHPGKVNLPATRGPLQLARFRQCGVGPTGTRPSRDPGEGRPHRQLRHPQQRPGAARAERTAPSCSDSSAMPGLRQMDVRINESGRDERAAEVDDVHGTVGDRRRRLFRPHPCDGVTVHEHGRGEGIGGGVDGAVAVQRDLRNWSGPSCRWWLLRSWGRNSLGAVFCVSGMAFRPSDHGGVGDDSPPDNLDGLGCTAGPAAAPAQESWPAGPAGQSPA